MCYPVYFSIAEINFCYIYPRKISIDTNGTMKEFLLRGIPVADVTNWIFFHDYKSVPNFTNESLFSIKYDLKVNLSAETPAWTLYKNEDREVVVFHPDGHFIGWMESFGSEWRTHVTTENYSPHLLPLAMTGFLLQKELNRRQAGFIMHGATLAIEGNGIVLSGNSGVGKSTLSHLSRETLNVKILTDDRIIVTSTNDGLYVYGNPLDRKNDVCHNDRCRLKSILMLNHGHENMLIKLNRNEAIKALLTICMLPYGNEENLKKSVFTLIKMAETIPVYTYSFIPDKSAAIFLSKNMGELLC